MNRARLGNFPLQRLGVRGDSMRSNPPRVPTENAEPTHGEKASWVLARIWPFGEFSDAPADSPKSKRQANRARKLVGKVLVIQRLGGADGNQPDFVQIKRLIKIDRLDNGTFGFWVEGDNKTASTDSRHWGYLKGSEIRGRVIFSRGLH